MMIIAGCRALREAEVGKVFVDPCGDAEAAGEAALLSLFKYDELKSSKKPPVEVACLDENNTE